MDNTFIKHLTDKEFREVVTPFIKAYKKKDTGELDIHNNLIINNKEYGVGICKYDGKFILQCDITIVDKNEPNYNWEYIGAEHNIESKDNATTEIMDFLAYEYQREMNKKE